MSRFQEIITNCVRYWLPDERIISNHRPDWLFGMELDLFLPNLNIAIEVQGRQHYQFTPEFHKTRADFQAQKMRDNRKKALCKKHGVRLIIARQGGGKFACGLKAKLREATGRPMRMQTESMVKEWKMHSAKLHIYSVGVGKCLGEWRQSSALLERFGP